MDRHSTHKRGKEKEGVDETALIITYSRLK